MNAQAHAGLVARADSSAAAPSPAAPLPGEPAARRAVDAYLALWSPAEPADAASHRFTDDIVLSYRHSIPELRADAKGRASALTLIRSVARLGRDWRFGERRFFATPRRDVYFVQYTATGLAAADGAPIEQRVLLCIELNGGRIARLEEFVNPALVAVSRPPASSVAARTERDARP